MRVTDKGQITIPRDIRELADLHEGSEVEFCYENGRVWLSKVEQPTHAERIRERLAQLRGVASTNLDMSTDEWMRTTRGES